MRLIHSILLAILRRLRKQDGLVMLYALAATLVVLASSAAAFAAIDNDLPLSTADSSEKQAYSAAQAGVQRFLFELNENSSYWTQCGVGTNWVFNTGVKVKPQQVPGSTSETYAVTLLPAAGQSKYKACNTSDPVDSMVQQSGNGAGSIRISSTGYAGGLSRTIVAVLREQSFLDYAWFDQYDTSDPSVQVDEAYKSTIGQHGGADSSIEPPVECAAAGKQAPSGCGSNYDTAKGDALTQCAKYRYQGRYDKPFFSDSSGSYYCDQIEFVTGDGISGPFHSDDSIFICGQPAFGTNAGDSVEFGGPSPGWVGDPQCGGNQPTIDGSPTGTASQSSNILIPKVNTLGSIATLSYSGTTCLTLTATGINVSQPSASYPSCFSNNIPVTYNVPYPSNGVLNVNNSTTQACPGDNYDVDDPNYAGNNGCGTVYVSGVDAKPLTIGAENDIVVDGNLTYVPGSNAILGLIAQNFVRVYHPVGDQPLNSNPNGCSSNTPNVTGAGGTVSNLTIDAMILSLNHSFIVDQYDCGSQQLGTLTVNGGIAQEFRGVVGTGGGGGTGYLKNYIYDPRLRYEEPPHFLTPVEGAWKVGRETECNLGATVCASTTLS